MLVTLLADFFRVVEPEDVVFAKDYPKAGSKCVRLGWGANLAVQELREVQLKSTMPWLVAHRLATWRDGECDYAVLIVKEAMLL